MPTMNSEHAVVLGFASNLGAEQFTPFLESLRRTSFAGRTCVFVSNMAPADVDVIARSADQVIDVDVDHPPAAPPWSVAALRRLKDTRGLRRFYDRGYGLVGRAVHAHAGSAIARDLEFRLQGVQALRYQHYLEYVEADPTIAAVMISDLRDVLFQGDPFAAELDGLEVFLEEPHVRTDTEAFNSRWLLDLYGDQGLARIAGSVVSCSGVTIGRREPMLQYLRLMAAEVDRQVIPLGPHDQGIHNWLLHTGRLPFATIVANGAGRVLTMGAQRVVYLSPGGEVLNPDASRPAVLHQYDRHPRLSERLRAELGSGEAGQPGT